MSSIATKPAVLSEQDLDHCPEGHGPEAYTAMSPPRNGQQAIVCSAGNCFPNTVHMIPVSAKSAPLREWPRRFRRFQVPEVDGWQLIDEQGEPTEQVVILKGCSSGIISL